MSLTIPSCTSSAQLLPSTCCSGNDIRIIRRLCSYECTAVIVSSTPQYRSASSRHRIFNGNSGKLIVCVGGVVNTASVRCSILLLQTKHSVRQIPYTRLYETILVRLWTTTATCAPIRHLYSRRSGYELSPIICTASVKFQCVFREV